MKSSNWKCFAAVALGLLGAGQATWAASNSPESLDEARLDAVTETPADSFFLETMGESELEEFCRDWDSSMAEGLATGPGGMLGQLIARDKSQARRFCACAMGTRRSWSGS